MSKSKFKSAAKPYNENNEKIKINMKVKRIKSNPGVYKENHTRNEIFQIIAENTNLNKNQVEAVFAELHTLIQGHLSKRGSGEFVVPKTGIKIRRVKKKATKQRSMISPLTGKQVTITAKPARASVKLTALKLLKESVTQ